MIVVLENQQSGVVSIVNHAGTLNNKTILSVIITLRLEASRFITYTVSYHSMLHRPLSSSDYYNKGVIFSYTNYGFLCGPHDVISIRRSTTIVYLWRSLTGR